MHHFSADTQEVNATLGIQSSSIHQKHDFYVALTDFLLPAYDPIQFDKKEHLRQATYLYFRALLEVDSLLDDKFEKNTLFRALGFLEEAIKHLSVLFPTGHAFWSEFNAFKTRYFEAICLEQKLSQKDSVFDKTTYQRLASNKSALCYGVLVALKHATGTSSENKLLYPCLEHIHLAFQYLDDIDDFQRDIEAKQRTYAHIITFEKLRKEPKQPENITGTFLHRYFYTSGVATRMINYALDHLQKAIALAQHCKLIHLKKYLELETKKRTAQKSEISMLIKKTMVKYSFREELSRNTFQLQNLDSAIIKRTPVEAELYRQFKASKSFIGTFKKKQ